MRTEGQTKYRCFFCGYDCSAPDKDGDANEICASRTHSGYCKPIVGLKPIMRRAKKK